MGQFKESISQIEQIAYKINSQESITNATHLPYEVNNIL